MFVDKAWDPTMVFVDVVSVSALLSCPLSRVPLLISFDLPCPSAGPCAGAWSSSSFFLYVLCDWKMSQLHHIDQQFFY